MKRPYLIIIFIFFLIYCSISLVNHYFFRTYACDLGFYTNCAFRYDHFHWKQCVLDQTLPAPALVNDLTDHFTPILIFISPILYLFGSYGLLVAQILFILFGGIGIYKYVFYKTGSPIKANLFLIHFYGFFGVISALGFDFHTNVIGAMFVPWFFYYIECNKIRNAVICFLLLLISKENMPLWAAFIASGLLFTNYRDVNKRKVLIALTVFSAIYFIVITSFIMPALANPGWQYSHLSYHCLGNNYKEILQTLIRRPRYAFTLLFETPDGSKNLFGIKSELHFLILLSGGYALLRKPQYLWMLLPIYAQKMFNDAPVIWSIGAQYSIEYAPILSITLFEFFQLKAFKKSGIWLSVTAVLLSLAATVSSIDNEMVPYYNPIRTRFYDISRYKTSFSIKKINTELEKIPSSAKVSASTSLVSHLSLRDFIYQYPVVNDANYILILADGNSYPLNMNEWNEKIEELKKDTNWKKEYDDNSLLIFKRSK